MTEPLATRVALRTGRFVLRRVSDLLPEARCEWGVAVMAELEMIPEPRARLAFMLSAAAGLSRVILRDAVRGRVADARVVFAASGVGLIAAATDLAASSRAPAAALIAAACFTLSVRVTRAAWRWPLLVGGMLPLVIAVSGYAGPYAYDRGDQWYAVGLAFLTTAIGLAARAGVLATRAIVRQRSAR